MASHPLAAADSLSYNESKLSLKRDNFHEAVLPAQRKVACRAAVIYNYKFGIM
jgi:hypothetical protein